MTTYREPEDIDAGPRAYITPDAMQTCVIFLDHIMYIKVNENLIQYVMTNGTTMNFTYKDPKRPHEEMKKVAEAKQRWDEHKARLAGKFMLGGT